MLDSGCLILGYIYKLIEHSDSTNPKSLWSVGSYGPYGFRLVERAYSSERPEATI
jgi:hypothetical protein